MWVFFTGTGSDVKAPKTTGRGKHSRANQNERRHSSANIPALRDGNNSQGEANSTVDSLNTNGSGMDVPPDTSANTQHITQNNGDWDGVRATAPHNRDRGLTSPQKHREKRKHCDSGNTDRHKSKKHKHSKGARFEGHRISHLVKKKTYKKEEPEDKAEKQSDDYVLAKLFKRSGGFLDKAFTLSDNVLGIVLSLCHWGFSGIHSVMQHDTIMESSNPDYVLVEAEANRVAKDALKALKVSRQQCRVAFSRPPPPPARYGLLDWNEEVSLSLIVPQTVSPLTFLPLTRQETVRAKEELSPAPVIRSV